VNHRRTSSAASAVLFLRCGAHPQDAHGNLIDTSHAVPLELQQVVSHRMKRVLRSDVLHRTRGLCVARLDRIPLFNVDADRAHGRISHLGFPQHHSAAHLVVAERAGVRRVVRDHQHKFPKLDFSSSLGVLRNSAIQARSAEPASARRSSSRRTSATVRELQCECEQ
jgi:hypothetical protein